MTPTVGARVAQRWLDERGVEPTTVHWYFEMTLATSRASCLLDLNIYPVEWGFVLRDGPHVSAIRITDEPFAAGGCDDLHLLPAVQDVERIDDFVLALERRAGIQFERHPTNVRSNLRHATAVVRAWLHDL